MTRLRTTRAIARCILGVLLLLAATVAVLLAGLGATIFSLLTAPWRRTRLGQGGLGRLRRVLAIAAVYAGTEIAGLTLAAGRWARYLVTRDAERDRRARARSLTRALNTLRTATERFGGLVAEQDPDTPPLPAGPLIVCGRHGGIGGAFLLAHVLLAQHGRLPRVVLKQTLAWDPLIAALLSRIPHAFIDPRPGDQGATAARIGVVAQDMAADDALLIFPEGGNFTPGRRTRAIRRLRRRGLAKAAARAERLRNVMPPHPDGLLTAIAAAPEADIVFVAHTGLEHLQSASDLWHALPLRVPVVFTWWSVPAAEVPQEAQAQVEWLTEHWSRIDGWVSGHRAEIPTFITDATGHPKGSSDPEGAEPMVDDFGAPPVSPAPPTSPISPASPDPGAASEARPARPREATLLSGEQRAAFLAGWDRAQTEFALDPRRAAETAERLVRDLADSVVRRVGEITDAIGRPAADPSSAPAGSGSAGVPVPEEETWRKQLLRCREAFHLLIDS